MTCSVNAKPGADAPGRNQNKRVGLPGIVWFSTGCLSFLLLLDQYGDEIISWVRGSRKFFSTAFRL